MDKNREAIQMMQEGKYEEAAKLFNELIEENPSDPLGYINFGNLLVELQEAERAERFFLKAINLDDTAATAYYGLGNLYFEQEQFKKANGYFEQALDKGLEDAHLYYLLGLSLQYQEQFKLALPYLLRATELAGGEINYRFQYGLSLAQAELVDEAKTVFQEVIEMDETHSDAHYNLGVIAVFNEDAEQALKHFSQALKEQPDHYLAANGKKQVEQFLENQ
ncbi:tetratricopeptide repeat protein [Oceanobacillus alkalisoli]|uniref:tetratricopeptide repeat protein n=1 Tax=Oceanobacillus alkalisoli TaxID=2925113 RepID=UPI001EEFBD8F|nr:tetratricopeptide repeat protein [Oceanobacillus alkalisoli]MCF3941851.1 tetratricopeptide repeat protein [Oceanobacillus alkalisoli]MCG5103131.1 tetratricopeptide repeat protein [Oceanobacillus alkalisoli]